MSLRKDAEIGVRKYPRLSRGASFCPVHVLECSMVMALAADAFVCRVAVDGVKSKKACISCGKVGGGSWDFRMLGTETGRR